MTPRVLFLDQAGVLGGAELSLLDVARHFAAGSTVLLFEDGPFRARLEAAGAVVEVVTAAAAVSRVRRKGGVMQALRSLTGVLKLAGAVARAACEKLLANPVMEDYSIVLEQVEQEAA